MVFARIANAASLPHKTRRCVTNNLPTQPNSRDLEKPSMPHLQMIQLPVFLILLFSGLGVLGLYLLYRRNRQVQAEAEDQFRQFRERAVGLMDQIDSLRNRHKTLPSTDPDFTKPMAGATLALYEKVAGDLDRLWDRWLTVMEMWNKAETRMKSTSAFSTRSSEEARQIISESRLEDLLHDSAQCKAELDRLNLAHEVAAKALKDGRWEAAAFARKIEGGGPRGGEGDLYKRELRLAERELEDAEKILVADPIGAVEAIERSRDAIADVQNPPATRPRARNQPTGPVGTILDDLVLAAGRLQELASKIRVIDIVSLIIKGWVALWVLGLFLAILPALMPLILLFMAFIVFGSGLRVFQRLRSPWAWDWTAPKKHKRRPWDR